MSEVARDHEGDRGGAHVADPRERYRSRERPDDCGRDHEHESGHAGRLERPHDQDEHDRPEGATLGEELFDPVPVADEVPAAQNDERDAGSYESDEEQDPVAHGEESGR